MATTSQRMTGRLPGVEFLPSERPPVANSRDGRAARSGCPRVGRGILLRLEQRKAVEAPPETSMRIALFWHLAKQPLWWLGIFVDFGGFIAQIAALGLADVVFVQPVLMMSLPFSLLLGGMAGSHRLSRHDL